jgi:hypothetical protein
MTSRFSTCQVLFSHQPPVSEEEDRVSSDDIYPNVAYFLALAQIMHPGKRVPEHFCHEDQLLGR